MRYFRRTTIPRILGIFIFSSFLIGGLNPAYSAEGKNVPLATRETQPVVKVLIKTIVIQGNSLIPTSVLESIVAPFTNKQLSFEDAKYIALLITNEYRKRGYFLAQAYVPYQRIVNGVLQINVIEGKLGKVRVEGNKFYSAKFILSHFAPATTEGTLRYASLEKYIMLLNENTDLHVGAVLQPGQAPGTTDVLLKVQDSAPDHIDGDFNNFGTLTGGVYQPAVTFSFGNFIREGSDFSVRFLYPFPTKSNDLWHPIASVNYATPVNTHGTKITAAYSSSDVRLGQDLDVLNVVGNTNITSFGFSQALARSDANSSNLTGNLSFKSSHNFVLGSQTSRDVLREWAMTYSTNWISGSGSNLFDATVTRGLGTMFGGEANNDPNTSVVGAGDAFTKLNIDLYRFQSLGSGILMILKGQGQYADTALVSPETFLLGGSESIRGYRPAEITGDTGYNAGIEFRIPVFTRPKSNLQFEMFSDLGSAYTHLPSAGTLNSQSLWGGGVGLRFFSGSDTAVRLEVGWPLTPKVNSVTNTTKESPVLYADFSTRFK